MNHPETAREVEPASQPRAERSTAGLVAQYIHELSGRRLEAREGRRGGERDPV